MLLVLGVILAVMSLLLLTMQKTYDHLPRYELKRRARGEDHAARALYKAVAYDSSLSVVMWLLIGLSSAASFVLLSRALPLAFALGVVALLVWWSFVWLPGGNVSKWSLALTKLVTPVIAWLVSHLHTPITWIQNKLPSQHASQSDIYETEDLLALLEHQKGHDENRITPEELEAAQRVLTFGHRLVRDVVTPISQLRLISEDDPIGPILLTELNDNGQGNFVVYKDKTDNVVGTLRLQDAVNARGGRVANVMQSHLVYVNESQSLAHVLDAFHATKAHNFMVVNRFDEFVGIVTIEQVLHEALGELSAKYFDAFESRESVVNYQPVLEPVEEPGESEVPEQTEESVTEPQEEIPPISLDE